MGDKHFSRVLVMVNFPRGVVRENWASVTCISIPYFANSMWLRLFTLILY